jgi:predicted aminopeptidase
MKRLQKNTITENVDYKSIFLYYFKFLPFILVFFLNGCAQISYYYQAVEGHLDITQRTKTLEEVISSPETSPSLRQQLQQVQQMRRFAIETLQLPDNESYTQYVDLQRKFVVWNVYAAPRFSLTAKQWCFPIVGCLSYRGYFSSEPAFSEAKELKKEGFDVYVAGIRAYSTLGWFADPLLNTMLSKETWQLAALIFHEKAHQLLYVQDDSIFNESFASAVEEIGVQLWLEQQGTLKHFEQFLISKQRNQQMIFLVLNTKQKLAELYKQKISEIEMLKLKNEFLEELQKDYKKLKETEWNHYRGYDHWFAEVNNAKLLSVAMYEEYVPAFKKLFEENQRDFKKFYDQVRLLAALPKNERDHKLNELNQ